MTTNTFQITVGTPRVGWECPRCKACLSPDVSVCERCAPPYYAGQYQITYPPYTPTPTVPTDDGWNTPYVVAPPTVIISK